MKKVLLLLLLACSFFNGFTQDKSMYEKHWFIKGTDTLPYRLLLPKNYNASKKYPLLLVLHGAGERGNDNEAQLVHGWSLFLRDSVREKYPAIIVFPQCPANSFWSNVQFVYDSLTKKRTFNFLEAGEPTIALKMVINLLDDLED